MKSQISSVDLKYLVAEMGYLAGGRVDRIYHPSKEELIIQFFQTGKGKHIIRLLAGKYMFISEMKGINESPDGFCMYLRKHLEGKKLISIEQIGSERIAKFVFASKEETISLYVELFGRGNFIVCDDKGVISVALEQKKWADRSITKGERYFYPHKEFDFGMTEQEFGSILSKEKRVSYQLAKEIGVGGSYAEEICSRANVDKEKAVPNNLELEKLYRAFKDVVNNKIEPNIAYKQGDAVDVMPFMFKIYAGLETKEFKSFNAAFDFFYQNYLNKTKDFVFNNQGQIDKIKKIIDQQEKLTAQLGMESELEKKKGEAVYENYKLIDEIISELNKARKKFSFDEIIERTKNHKIIKKIDPKTKKVTIEI